MLAAEADEFRKDLEKEARNPKATREHMISGLKLRQGGIVATNATYSPDF